ncbi:uncharacterized protein LOC115366427 [Myripristis murdjan]|uniref:uncharacterized protein LOC115366427 n=1 Tax=Myripristis murdjan TaxID=586833 RepID=UPI0011760239|nr:uncharacterized protein LOC115366427 [Myripristis murdjan]
MDVESLQKSERRRGRCLDVFLVTSVLVLFMLVAAVVAGGVMVTMELRSKVAPMRPPIEVGTPAKLTGDTPAPAYKMQNLAYLEATSSQLKNFTMSWSPVLFGAGKSIGSHFHFEPTQHSLQPRSEGHYFIYLNLNVTCTHRCNASLLTVHLGDKLTCKMELPQGAVTPVSKQCWTVAHLDDQMRLVAQMIVPKEELTNWKLEPKGSNFGMFLMD